MTKPAIFLDRDNTLISADGDLHDPSQVRLIKGAASAIASLRGLGYKIVVVSNQAGVAHGRLTEAGIQAIHQRINELIKANSGAVIDRFYYCPFDPQGSVAKYRGDHPWRKPNPGMLLQAAKDLQLDLSHSWMISDQEDDVQAGAAAKVRTIRLCPNPPNADQTGGNGRDDQPYPSAGAGPAATATAQPDFLAPTLIEAVKLIAQHPTRLEPTSDGTARKPPNPSTPAVTPGVLPASGHPVEQPAVALTAAQPGPLARPTPDAARSTATARPGPAVRPAPGPQTPTPTLPENPQVKPSSPPPPPTPTQARATSVASATPEVLLPGVPGARAGEHAGPSPAESLTDQPLAQAAPAVEPQPAQPSTPISPSPHEADPEAVPSTTSGVLRQILQELRLQRAARADFSYLTVLAIVLEMIVVVCLLGALWMGAGDLAQYIRWLGTGLVLQLATVATLLFRR
jgi:D-glycero-D-manno-heptose 1,7-bisphosphate phosphatase